MTRVAVLTPPGTGAIATAAVVGPAAWDVVRQRFRPAGGNRLPDAPVPNRVWFGTLGDGPGDEVVVAARPGPEPWVEVHCHGGRQVMRWVVDQLVSAGCRQARWQEVAKPTRCNGWAFDPRALEPLALAPTQRAAGILLDQYHGAFTREVEAVLAGDDAGRRLARLHALAPVGRHLVEPWRVVIAGPPNVGKSSLVNALAGFQRSVVAPVAGTTRDVVTTTVALDGWPVELADTAGLREASESLEAEGVGRARDQLAAADLVVWVMDATDQNPTPPDPALSASPIVVANKSDQPPAWELATVPGILPVSALTGGGIAGLIDTIVRRLVPEAPAAGEAVPFTPALADAIAEAAAAHADGNAARVHELLATCLPG